ncbi:hypothetical protein ACU635_44035 [[Actinomadura] parvosata]|uniref:hypothetical protein n=1 Tax=[Actinomadura] parvosata TaxID=1955412 RepID=UPI00406C5F59
MTGYRTTRMFGNCPVKQCKHRAVVDATALEEPDRYVVGGVRLSPVFRRDGVGDGGFYQWWTVMDHLYAEGKLWSADLPDTRPRCPDHGCLLRWRQLDAPRVNPAKVCDGRCMGATGPACDCPCKGENHGSNNLITF